MLYSYIVVSNHIRKGRRVFQTRDLYFTSYFGHFVRDKQKHRTQGTTHCTSHPSSAMSQTTATPATNLDGSSSTPGTASQPPQGTYDQDDWAEYYAVSKERGSLLKETAREDFLTAQYMYCTSNPEGDTMWKKSLELFRPEALCITSLAIFSVRSANYVCTLVDKTC